MRRSSLVSLIITMSVFGFYFLAIDPLLANNRWAAFIMYMLMFLTLRILHEKLQGRFEYLDKRMDAQSSVWLVIAISIFFFSLIGALA